MHASDASKSSAEIPSPIPASTNKNAPQDCEAFGAENETRTMSCNILMVNDLEEAEKTTGET